MEFEREKTIESDPALESFHQEIQRLKEDEEKQFKEKEAKGDTGSIHLRDLNPEELTAEDRVIYHKFKNSELEEKEFYDWSGKMDGELSNLAPDRSEKREEFIAENSRYLFKQYIANKIGFWDVWEEKKQELRNFREEIDRLKKEEVRKMDAKEQYNPHLISIINPDKLTVRDMGVFQKMRDGSLKENSEDFLVYRTEIFKECQEHFREEVGKHKKLKDLIGTSVPEGQESMETQAFIRFQEVFSRSNFLAWIQNELIKKAYEEKKKKKQVQTPNEPKQP